MRSGAFSLVNILHVSDFMYPLQFQKPNLIFDMQPYFDQNRKNMKKMQF
jgi:hypothetical protein